MNIIFLIVYAVWYRCGMVYCDPEELRWMPYVQTWMATHGKRFKEETREYILDLFQRYVDDGLHFITKKCMQAMPQVMEREKRELHTGLPQVRESWEGNRMLLQKGNYSIDLLL